MNILVVDDQEDVIKSLADVLTDYRVIGAPNIASALKALSAESGPIGLAFIDIMIGSEDGMTLLKHIRSEYPGIECVVMTGYGSIENAVQAVKLGAYEYIEKPLSFQKVKIIIKNALAHRKLSSLYEKEIDKYRLIGRSKAVKGINELIERASQTDFPVLITGPSGSGKEHVAHLIHLKGPRGQNEMVKLNCAAIPGELFESELFGSEKGAYTGAYAAKKGKIEQADGGTLYLDEIGELPPPQQSKLLRVLEDRIVTPLGGDRKISVNFRLITATNRDLKKETAWKNFREDLFYRINVIVIDIPPLSDRKEDIPLLAEHFLRQAGDEYGSARKTFSEESLALLSGMPLKGNARELKNLVQRLTVFSDSEVITPDSVKLCAGGSAAAPAESPGIFQEPMSYKDAKRRLERKYLETQLSLHEGNISRTAKALDILPNNLQRRMKQLGIQ